MPYTPTTWVNAGAPAVDATNLNHMETQYTQALADIPEDQATGTPSERTLGTGALQAAAGDHDHTLGLVAVGSDGEGPDQVGAFAAKSTNITNVYGSTGRRRITLTPATAKAAVVCAGSIHQTNSRSGIGSILFSYRVVVGGSQRSEGTATVDDGDGTDPGAHHSARRLVYTEIDGAASSTNYDWEHKEAANIAQAHINDFGNALIVTEISI